jgi:hypothetical protein
MLKELFYDDIENSGACSKQGNNENTYRILGENPEWQ